MTGKIRFVTGLGIYVIASIYVTRIIKAKKCSNKFGIEACRILGKLNRGSATF